jgi:hypothetical protein
MGVLPASNSKPFVQIACVCEKVLIEPDNVASLIRVVDTYALALPTPELPAGVQIAFLIAFISLKSGDVVGEFEVGLRLNHPDGKDYPIRRWPVEFRGGESGVNLKIAFSLPDAKFGLYWFDVLWGDEVLTRIPFRLKAASTESTASEAAPTETTTH